MHEHILAVASRLFYDQGVRAVGIDLVIKEADIARATLYRHFPNKEALIVSYLNARRDKAISEIRSTMTAAPSRADSRVDAIFLRLHRVVSGNFRGCAFLRALSEHLDSPDIQVAVTMHKDAIRGVFEDSLAGLDLTAKRRLDLAASLALIYDGALVTAMVRRRSDEVLLAKEAALCLIQGLADTRPSRPG